MAVLLAAKLGVEQLQGPLPFAGKGVPVVVDAHLYGALGGLAAAALLLCVRHASSRPPRDALQ